MIHLVEKSSKLVSASVKSFSFIGEIKMKKKYFNLNKFRVTDERRWNAKGKLVTDSEATVHLEVKNEEKMTILGNSQLNELTHNTPAVGNSSLFFRTYSKLFCLPSKSL